MITPYGSGRYLVQSSTRPEVEHVVDLEENEYGPEPRCSCEDSMMRKRECKHIRAVKASIAPVILALMQNQWLNNAAYHQRRFDDLWSNDREKFTKLWRRTVEFALFRGCASGRTLKRHLGPIIKEIVWDEASRTITDKASGCPPADPAHIQWTIGDVRPSILLTFGRIAADAVKLLAPPVPQIIHLPHPAARGANEQAQLAQQCAALLAQLHETSTLDPAAEPPPRRSSVDRGGQHPAGGDVDAVRAVRRRRADSISYDWH